MKHKLLRLGSVTKNILNITSQISNITLDILFEKTNKSNVQKSKSNAIAKRQYISKKLDALIVEGYIDNKAGTYQLSEKGRTYLWKIKQNGLGQNKNWDHKWRIVCFDIQEKSRIKRDLLRLELKHIGFIQLQQSVWIYPFACEGYIELLQSHYSFGKNVKYMIVEKISDDISLKKHFKLI